MDEMHVYITQRETRDIQILFSHRDHFLTGSGLNFERNYEKRESALLWNFRIRNEHVYNIYIYLWTYPA